MTRKKKKAPPDRSSVRVFISSTFRDMQAERDELIKRVFPEIRKLCEQRGVTWSDVDLRWGITAEQAERGEVLPICLAEIERCRPYFIGLLGERYGWIPDEIPQEVLQREQWLVSFGGHSVTELEILHGVLNNPAMSDHAFFYLRDPSYLKRLPPDADPSDFVSESDLAKSKLNDLKERIRNSGFPVFDNYFDPKALGELVRKDLTALIDRLFPEGSRPDPLEAEAAEHQLFAKARADFYIRRREYFDRLDAHVSGDGPPLVVVGESGIGKTALLANWAIRFRKTHPDDLMLTHFVGATHGSVELPALLKRFVAELERHYGVKSSSKSGAGSLSDALAESLRLSAAHGRVVLVLDGLDQLVNARDLVWLPLGFPANVRVIVSTAPGVQLDELQRRRWTSLEIEPLKSAARGAFTTKYLARYSKALSTEQLSRVVRARQTAQPLYLRTLLEEVRLYGDHATIDRRINHYLEAPTVWELYVKVLERCEEDYEYERTGLVRDAMSLLWAARRGLSEPELLDMLGSGESPMPGAFWSPLSLALDSALANHSGRLSFLHDAVRQAVEKRYLPEPQDRQAAHLRIANYFERRDVGQRKVDELPWQLSQAGEWERLASALGDIELFAAAWAADQLEVRAYWTQIEANSSLRFADAYREVVEDPEKYKNYAWLLPSLSTEVMAWGVPGAFEIGMQLDPIGTLGRRFGEDYLKYVRPKGDPGRLLQFLANSDDPFKKAEELLGELQESSADSIAASGDPEKQLSMFQRMERLARDMGDREPLAVALGGQALIFEKRGDLARAIELFREEELLYRELHHETELSRNLGNQARILEQQRQPERVLTLLREQERIEMKLGRADQILACRNNQARIQATVGDTGSALDTYEELEQMSHQTLDRSGLAHSLFAQADLFARQGDPVTALAKFQEAGEIFRQTNDFIKLNRALHNQAVLLSRNLDRSDEALPLAEEALELALKYDPESTVSTQGLVNYVLSKLKRQADINQTSVDSANFSRASSLAVSIPTPHPAADAERAAERNIEYQQELSRWEKLPWWKRIKMKKPEPPKGI